MPGRWTPGRASLITVTLTGRVTRCSGVRDAIRSLDSPAPAPPPAPAGSPGL